LQGEEDRLGPAGPMALWGPVPAVEASDVAPAEGPSVAGAPSGEVGGGPVVPWAVEGPRPAVGPVGAEPAGGPAACMATARGGGDSTGEWTWGPRPMPGAEVVPVIWGERGPVGPEAMGGPQPAEEAGVVAPAGGPAEELQTGGLAACTSSPRGGGCRAGVCACGPDPCPRAIEACVSEDEEGPAGTVALVGPRPAGGAADMAPAGVLETCPRDAEDAASGSTGGPAVAGPVASPALPMAVVSGRLQRREASGGVDAAFVMG
jgi:hypothetical protein